MTADEQLGKKITIGGLGDSPSEEDQQQPNLIVASSQVERSRRRYEVEGRADRKSVV